MPSNRSRLPVPRFILAIAALTTVLAILIGTDAIPFLRGGFGWQWPYVPVALLRLIPLIIATAIYVAGGWWWLQRVGHIRLTIGWAMLGAAILPLLVIAVRFDNVPYELFARTVSRLTSGAQAAAAVIGWDGSAWRDWATFVHQPDWAGGHVAVAAPGLPMWYAALGYGFNQVGAIGQPLYRALLPWQCQNYDMLAQTSGAWASAWFGMLMPLWASLTVIPLYLLANHFTYTKRLARAVVLWFPLIPSLLMFAPDWNTLYPLLSLLVFGLLVLGIERRKFYWLVLAGLIAGVGLFMAYTFVPLIMLMGFYTLLYVFLIEPRRAGENGERRRLQWSRPLIIGLWFGIGLSVPWILYWIWSGVSPLAMASLSLTTHLEIDRPYLPWVFIHYWDWSLFSGIGLMLMWYAGLWLWLRRRTDRADVPVLALSLLITAALLTVSGTARGESGRVWSLLTPFALLAAAEGLGRSLSDTQPYRPAWLTLAVVQAVLTIALVGSLDVINTDLTAPPPSPAATANVTPIQATFNAGDGSGNFQLIGWHGTITNGKLTLALRWQGEQTITHPYWFGVVLVAPDKSTYNAGIWQPGGMVISSPAAASAASRGTYPTTCWRTGAALDDTVTLPLPSAASRQAGQWWVSLAAYGDSSQSDGHLTVTLPASKPDTQVGLGPIIAG